MTPALSHLFTLFWGTLGSLGAAMGPFPPTLTARLGLQHLWAANGRQRAQHPLNTHRDQENWVKCTLSGMPQLLVLALIMFHQKRLALVIFLPALAGVDTVALLPAPLPAPQSPALWWPVAGAACRAGHRNPRELAGHRSGEKERDFR